MKFERNNSSVVRYILKRLEMALGLGLILLVAINEDLIPSILALAIFLVAVLANLPKLIKSIKTVKNTHLEITSTDLYIKSPTQEQVYCLKDFKIMLYKKGPQGVISFVLMNETQGVKLEYYSHMNELFLELGQHVKMQKKIPWWQRL
jgi:hypothetical protein